MKRVTGIGGIFFNAKDPVALRAWYKQRLGIDVQSWGGAAFHWTDNRACGLHRSLQRTSSVQHSEQISPW